MSDTWLSPEEIADITALKPNSYKAQCRKLSEMGVPFKPNAIGRPLVERDAYLSRPKQTRKRKEPNWEALNGTAA